VPLIGAGHVAARGALDRQAALVQALTTICATVVSLELN